MLFCIALNSFMAKSSASRTSGSSVFRSSIPPTKASDPRKQGTNINAKKNKDNAMFVSVLFVPAATASHDFLVSGFYRFFALVLKLDTLPSRRSRANRTCFPRLFVHSCFYAARCTKIKQFQPSRLLKSKRDSWPWLKFKVWRTARSKRITEYC